MLKFRKMHLALWKWLCKMLALQECGPEFDRPRTHVRQPGMMCAHVIPALGRQRTRQMSEAS